MLLADPEIALRVQGNAADADPTLKDSDLGWIIGGEPHDRVRLGIADPDAVLCINGDAERRLQTQHLTMRPSFTRPPGKYSKSFFVPSAIQTSPFAATPTPISPPSWPAIGEVAFLCRWDCR